MEDEWLIVYMLRELTRSFPQLWVRLSDGDGEFLLVEAAKVVPKWLTPEMDGNRVWIHEGRLFIIPAEEKPSSKTRALSLSEALAVIRSLPDSLVHSTFVEAEAFYRLEKYPGQIALSIHRSLVTIPRRLAYVLHTLPRAIAPAVEAFYLRDPLAMRILSTESEKLVFQPSDLVTVSVRFTKVLFAQLKSQHFDSPPAWKSVLDPETKKLDDFASGEEERRRSRLEMGMKLTSSFEMLAANMGKSDSRVAREFGIVLEDLAEDGDQALPTDDAIKSWKDVDHDDDESWMDINYEDFERELQGKQKIAKSTSAQALGDSTAQADLRKIVSRFEAFLNDESAGLDGAEADAMDSGDDDDDEDEVDDSSEDEDKEVSFDEEEFARMMREMMGMPPTKPSQPRIANSGGHNASSKNEKDARDRDVDVDDAEDAEETEQIRKLTEQMEAELNEHRALQLDPTPKKLTTLKGKEKDTAIKPRLPAGKSSSSETTSGGDKLEESSGDDDEDGEIDIDYNLAKNLLESFKSQGGLSGPAGNILGMMGLRLPRDEDEDDGDLAEASSGSRR